VALEALKGHSPVHELTSRDGVHPAQITRWKPPLEDGVDAICSRGQPTRVRAEEALRARLSQEIGPLKVELDWLQRQVSPRCSQGGDA
jgi:hypothetical protein